MTQYENYTFGASVTMSHGDVGLTDEDARRRCASDDGRRALTDRITDEVMSALNELLIEEVSDAARLTDVDKSFILRTFLGEDEDEDEAPIETPSERKRVTRG
jgi:hypothetical protein